MAQNAACRVFISYRRADAAGYAGRLEESLEQRLGRGSVFRDLADIVPGAEFVTVIREHLSQAHTVLVLIGPRWAGDADAERRRIDDPADLVRLEVQEALASAARVVPVMLPGASMPTEHELPAPLQALARRNALSISDAHWDADIQRLVKVMGVSPRRAAWRWALGGAVLTASAAAALVAWRTAPPADVSAALLGTWTAEVTYAWGDRHTERFEFSRHAGALVGTASFLGYPRAAEQLQFDGQALRFETRSEQSMGDETREQVRRYAAEWQGTPPNAVLVFRMESSGGFGSPVPITFEAVRSTPAPATPQSGTR